MRIADAITFISIQLKFFFSPVSITSPPTQFISSHLAERLTRYFIQEANTAEKGGQQ